MKHLVIYSHPNPKSFNAAIKDVYLNTLIENQHQVRISDLYAINFNPVLLASDFESFHQGIVPEDIKIEQENIVWADLITFIFPIWWAGFGAMLKGYIDRVFSYKFAYEIVDNRPQGLLNGKKVFLITTTGGLKENYEAGLAKGLDATIHKATFNFCNLDVVGHKYFFSVPFITKEERVAMLDEVKEVVNSISF